MGWLFPVVVMAKIIMQSLWLLKTGWEETSPPDLTKRWQNWLLELPSIRRIKIPCWIEYTSQTELIEIHGFADDSKFAYGAVDYPRLIYNQTVSITLQVAKTRVLPLKTHSLLRLELCAALLLARLVQHFEKSVSLTIESTHLWSDSADVLFWLRDHPAWWDVLVASRCSEIHTLLPNAYWHHVRSCDNPADVISRSIEPSKFSSHRLR